MPRVLREYELMYVVRPDLDEDGLRGAVEAVQTLVEGQGGEVTTTTPWGKRRLAYEIAGLRDGHYVIVEFRGDGSSVKELERALRISDHVIRHMITIAVPKPPEAEPREGRRDRGAAAAEEEAGDGVAVSGEIDAEEVEIEEGEIEDLELAAAGDEDETREER
ncbi:MAG TPA: 30S ribosomal protein S6 [Candidatus Dormibacteraeota bacterium]